MLASLPIPDMIPIEEQAAALVNGRAFELASKYCNGDLRLLDERWTITIADLIRYVKENGIPAGWLHFRPETFDGLYLIQSGSVWSVYKQERGEIPEESRRSFCSDDAALEYVLLNYYMPASRRTKIADSDVNAQNKGL